MKYFEISPSSDGFLSNYYFHILRNMCCARKKMGKWESKLGFLGHLFYHILFSVQNFVWGIFLLPLEAIYQEVTVDFFVSHSIFLKFNIDNPGSLFIKCIFK